jgi:hypothetical protein
MTTDDLTTLPDDKLKWLLEETDLRITNEKNLCDMLIERLKQAKAQIRETEGEQLAIQREIERREAKDKPVPFGYVGTRNTAEARQREINVWASDRWFPIIKKLDEDLAELVPEYSLDQLKEKFGGLRYYVSFPEWTPEPVRALASVLILTAESDVNDLEREEEDD